jgi:hypothetical protein
VKKQHRSLVGKNLISGSEMSWRLGNSIRLRLENCFAALEDLSVCEDINRAWENIKENIKTSAKKIVGLYEMKQHKPKMMK